MRQEEYQYGNSDEDVYCSANAPQKEAEKRSAVRSLGNPIFQLPSPLLAVGRLMIANQAFFSGGVTGKSADSTHHVSLKTKTRESEPDTTFANFSTANRKPIMCHRNLFSST